MSRTGVVVTLGKIDPCFRDYPENFAGKEIRRGGERDRDCAQTSGNGQTSETPSMPYALGEVERHFVANVLQLEKGENREMIESVGGRDERRRGDASGPGRGFSIGRRGRSVRSPLT